MTDGLTPRQRRAGEAFANRYPELAAEIAAHVMEMASADAEAASKGFAGKSLSVVVERLPAWAPMMGRRQLGALTLPDPLATNLTLIPPFGEISK